MSWVDGFLHRCRTLFDPRGFERDTKDELQHHLDLETMHAGDAGRARRRLGNRTYYVEERRRMTWLGMLDVVQQDARFAWRSLARNPGFTALTMLTLSLGIGVNAATFTILDRIFLRPPVGVTKPSELHRIWLHINQGGKASYTPGMTFPIYRVLRHAWSDTSQLALVYPDGGFRIGGTLRGARVDPTFTTANYWSVMGLHPQLGRFFDASEDRPGAGAPVIVLSDHLWRTQFGADPGVIGKPLILDELHLTIIGVAPRHFTGDDLHPAGGWIPVASTPQPPFMREPLLSSNRMYVFQVIGRAMPNEDLAAFSVRATQQLRAFIRSIPDKLDTTMTVTTGSINFARGPGEQKQANLISTRLSAVALIVLIIAAANVVNLLLARATHRRRELAVRLALGISRWRLVRMLTAETLLLALLAALVSLAVAWWGGAALRALVLSDVHFVDSPVDGRIVVFTIAIAVVAGLIAGIVPAIQASNPELTNALKAGAREGMAPRSRLRATLLVTQTALSVALLAGAALFVESLRNVQGLNIGYDAPNTVVASIDFDSGREPQPAVESAQMADVEAEVARLPGVKAAARTQQVPLMGASYAPIFVGSDTTSPSPTHYPVLNVVTQNFFAASGMQLLRGHAFVDRPGAAPEVVVNAAMAQQLFPHGDALRGCLRFQRALGDCWPISGIVENAPTMEITEPALQYYLPMSNPPKALAAEAIGTALVARVMSDDAARVEAGVRQALLREFPNSYPNVRLLSDVIAPQYQAWRVGASLFSGMSVLAMLVAIVGIYSTVSYSIGQRTHEFGVRIALGAQLPDVLRLVLGEGMRTVVIGVLIGIVLAVLSGRLIRSLLFGISPSNPGVMAMASVLLLLVAAVATLIPALRAGRVDPMVALRSE